MRIIIIFLVILTSALAQDFTGYKFYINPGHGGTDPANDRYIPETGFWESEGNLIKGLYFRDLLLKYNARVIMSRVTNYESDDRALSNIAAEANANNVDFFHSIHSNATGTTSKANYTLMLFRGYDNQPVFPAAKNMSQIMYNEIHSANRTESFSNGVRGDWSFYPQWGDKVGLGVLRPLTMPGVLSEGSFHDYIPESFRLTNKSYCHHEAVAFLRSFVKFYNKGSLPYGTIAGIVRDFTKDVSYTWLSSLPNDKKQPINGITVRMEPGGRVYHGDQKNNGFFFFDSVYVGSYKLYVSAEGYGVDSAEVVVTDDRPYFRDFFLTNNKPPVVLSYSPANPLDSVRINVPVVINFNTAMNKEKTEGAFHISPAVEGTITWQQYDQTLVFTAKNHFEPRTTYWIRLDTTAVNRFGVPLDSALTFSFTTDHIGRFMVESSYPGEKNDIEISTTVQAIIVFNYPLSYASLSGNFFVEDATGAKVPILRAKSSVENGKGVLRFELKNKLDNDKEYTIYLGGTVRSTYGITMLEPKRITFRTEKYAIDLAKKLDSFSGIEKWRSPASSPLSQGIDTVFTRLTLYTDRFVSSPTSAKLAYVFTGQEGRVNLSLVHARPLADLTSTSKIGFWIFGDRSFNVLEYVFRTQNDSLFRMVVDTIDWTGWKLKYIGLGDLDLTGTFFQGMILRQSDRGATIGEIYLDDFSMGTLTAVEKRGGELLPTKTMLFQNSPNPFNPTTTITYTLANDMQRVVLEIFDLLGRRVRLLVDAPQSVGEYRVVWDGCDDSGCRVAGGIYLCCLKVDEWRQVKRMVMIK